MLNSMSPKNVIQFYIVACKYEAEDLTISCLQYAAMNMKEITTTEEYEASDAELLKDFLRKSSSLKCVPK